MIVLISAVAIVVAAVVIGALVWTGERRARHVAKPAPVRVSAQTAATLQAELEETYRTEIHDSTAVFSKDLTATSQRLSAQVERLTTEVITHELEQYSQTLNEVRQIAAAAAEQIKTATAQQQAELRKALEATIVAEQERRLAQIDEHLSEIITGYLAEALGNGVDLGAQTNYILQSLETHKEQIKKDLASEL